MTQHRGPFEASYLGLTLDAGSVEDMISSRSNWSKYLYFSHACNGCKVSSVFGELTSNRTRVRRRRTRKNDLNSTQLLNR